MQNIIRKAVSANKTRDAKLKRERDAYFSKTKPVKTEKEVVLNDNTWVDNGRIKNPENKERSVKGGLANAAWVADNPIKSTIGQIAGIAPFGVMAYPVLAEAGVAAAPIVNSAVGGAALTSILSGKPAWDMVSGNADWTTPIDLIPLYGSASKAIGTVGRRFNRLYRTAPKITAKNATSITPKQWTAAQDAAIARGDMDEAQRLRDLHFKVSAPKTEIVDINGNPQLVVHKTPDTFTVFDNSRSIGNLNWFATPNAYGENGVFATSAGKNPRTMKLYVNMRNAHRPTIEEGMEPAFINDGEDGILGIVDKDMTNFHKSASDAGEGFMMSGGVDNPNALKSADVVTFDDKGVRIPLGERDNFNMNDIRYSWLPWLLGGASATTLYNILPTGRTTPNIY
jgi:hypothetical protein